MHPARALARERPRVRRTAGRSARRPRSPRRRRTRGRSPSSRATSSEVARRPATRAGVQRALDRERLRPIRRARRKHARLEAHVAEWAAPTPRGEVGARFAAPHVLRSLEVHDLGQHCFGCVAARAAGHIDAPAIGVSMARVGDARSDRAAVLGDPRHWRPAPGRGRSVPTRSVRGLDASPRQL